MSDDWGTIIARVRTADSGTARSSTVGALGRSTRCAAFLLRLRALTDDDDV